MRAAAWPLIRNDLDLTYAEIGVLLALPGFLGSAIEPLIGVLGDTGRRRVVILASGVAFTTSVALTAGALGFWTLLLALAIGNPSTSGFVSLSQAALMDSAPTRRERLLAWWTLVGSFGYVGGPLLLAAAAWIGIGDAALIPLLGHFPGRTYLRISALLVVPVYGAFLLVDEFWAKLVLLAGLGLASAGWYAIPKAALYEALPGRSGAAVAVSGFGGLVYSAVPAVLGVAAGAVGLGPTMWALLLAPIAILALVPRPRR